MTRAAAVKGSDLANPAPLAPGHFKGPDGRVYVSINLAKHKVFAIACLDALSKRGEPSQHFLLPFAKAVTVPVDVLSEARASLRPEETPTEYAA